MLDGSIAYLARESHPAAERLLIDALDTASSLDTFGERGRVVPELDDPSVRELFVGRYRLLYQVATDEILILAFIHGARDLTRWRPGG
jgi:plasmid stabilization system protein ParE